MSLLSAASRSLYLSETTCSAARRAVSRSPTRGQAAAAIFQVEHGQIVLWHQTAVPERFAPGGQVAVPPRRDGTAAGRF